MDERSLKAMQLHSRKSYAHIENRGKRELHITEQRNDMITEIERVLSEGVL